MQTEWNQVGIYRVKGKFDSSFCHTGTRFFQVLILPSKSQSNRSLLTSMAAWLEGESLLSWLPVKKLYLSLLFSCWLMSDSFAAPLPPPPMDCCLPGSSVLEFSRQEYWKGLSFPPSRIFQTQGSHSHLLHWQVDSLPLTHQGSPKKL